MNETFLRSTQRRPDHVGLNRVICVALLAAVLATFVGNYGFGDNAFVEIEPMVRAQMDASYLPGDLVAESGREFGPRFYFTWLLAWIADSGSLPYILFLATLVVNIATAIVAALWARDLFKSNRAAVVAVVLTMSVSAMQLGASPHIYAEQINSSRLAWPLAAGGLWAAYRRQPVLCGILTGVASLSHPTFGAEVGGLALFALAVVTVLERQASPTTMRRLAQVGGGLIVLGLFLLPILIPYAQMEHIPIEEFEQIRVLRNAHELLPSQFGLVEWTNAAFFLVAAGLAWTRTRKRKLPADDGARYLLSFGTILLAAFLVGAFFVEVVPVRVFFVLDVFHRLTPLLIWIGLILMAGEVALRYESDSPSDAYYLHIAALSPVSAGLARMLILGAEKTRLGRLRSMPSLWWTLAVSLLLAGLVISTTDPRALLRTFLIFFLISGMAGWVALAPRRWGPVLAPTAGVVIVVLALLAVQIQGGFPQVMDDIGPEILPSQVEGREIALAGMLKALTPDDALLVAPPALGGIRVFAERSLLVDFKAIPFQEKLMLEWRDRLFAVYGRPNSVGPESQAEMTDSYRDISDERIRLLCDDYGVTHAVLFEGTDTSLAVIGQMEGFKLVEVACCSARRKC